MGMVTVNKEKLATALDNYKKYFSAQWQDEQYKWEAVKCFQDNWDPEAENFQEMWTRATAQAGNLLTSFRNYPRGMVTEFAKADQESVRAMFVYLYDETVPLASRVQQFITSSDTLKEKYGYEDDGSVKWNQHYQNLNSISTYLWLRFPDKYFIYKVSEIRASTKILGSSFIPKSGQDVNMLISGYEFFNVLREALVNDEECRMLLEDRVEDTCYPDPELVTMAIDFDFYLSRFFTFDVNNTVRYWTYAPGEKARKWPEYSSEGIIGIGWDDLGDLSLYESEKALIKRMQELAHDDKSHKNDKCANWDFANKMKEGDIVYAKKGQSTVVGRGIVESDYVFDPSLDEYKSIRKVRWTNIGEWEPGIKMAQKTLTDITYYSEMIKKIENAINGVEEKPFEPSGYWWMCANPEIWHYNDISVGDEQNYTKKNEKGNKRQVIRNFDAAKPGDKIIGYEAYPDKKIFALCEITRTDEDSIFFKKTKSLEKPIDYNELKSIPELAEMEFFRITTGSLFYLSKKEYDTIMSLIENTQDDQPQAEEEPLEKYTREDFLSEVFLSGDECDELLEILSRKKNLILEGAPGVGKTFAAKRLAYLMLGCKDNKKIASIQFHQNYSYESFIEGYKPDKDSFHIERGIFAEFCSSAAKDPDNKYFFIIDEINRGNMSKIFGELLAIIESPYRGSAYALPLAYSAQPFYVPENVYLIGMMNTADRSLAVIDYALRRRFSFFEIEPGFDKPGFKALQEAINNDQFNTLVDTIKSLNKRIAEDPALGKGFRIGHSYFCVAPDIVNNLWLRTVAKYEIAPLLKEYWFDNSAKAEEETKKILESVE